MPSRSPIAQGDRGRVVFPNGGAYPVIVHEVPAPSVIVVRQVRDGRIEGNDFRLLLHADGTYRTPVHQAAYVPDPKEEKPMPPATPTPPLTDEEKELFEAIRDPEYQNFALLKGEFDGAPAAIIAAVNVIEHGEDEPEYHFSPLAVFLRPDMLDRVTMDGIKPADGGAPLPATDPDPSAARPKRKPAAKKAKKRRKP